MPSPGLNFPNTSRADFLLFKGKKGAAPVVAAGSVSHFTTLLL